MKLKQVVRLTVLVGRLIALSQSLVIKELQDGFISNLFWLKWSK